VNQSVNYFVDGFSKKNPWWSFIWGKVEELLELKYIVSLYLHFAYVHAQLASHVYRNCLGIWPSRSSSVQVLSESELGASFSYCSSIYIFRILERRQFALVISVSSLVFSIEFRLIGLQTV
jgi:hypothetical protein